MATNVEPSTSPTNTRPSSDDRKQSPPAFLDLADSAARLGSNMPDISARVELRRMEHERQRALHRRVFEDQMRALEQQQQQELLTLPMDSANGMQHLAVSAPTTPPRVNAVLPADVSPALRASFAQAGLDVDGLSQVVGSGIDKRKSVTYAPVTRSPEISSTLSAGPQGQGFARAVAKSMPASRRTSASEHDEELAGHLHNLSLVGERNSPMPTNQQSYFTRNGHLDSDAASYGAIYNAGMMLDEQLDEEMHNAMRHLPTSDDDKYQAALSKLQNSSAALDLAQAPPSRNSYGGGAPRSAEPREMSSEWPQFASSSPRPDSLANRGDRRTVTNPTLSLGDLSAVKLGTVSASATPHIPQLASSATHLQTPNSRRGSPASFAELSVMTRSVPATPLGGPVVNPAATLLAKTPGTPISPAESNPLAGVRLASQGSHIMDGPLGADLPTSLSRTPSSQFDYSGLSQTSFDESASSPAFGLNGGASYSPGGQISGQGSTALYHHNGTRYGLGLGRANGDGKMNGLHGPKHKRGDVDREFNRFTGTRLEDLVGEIPSLCKDQHGCRYLQKKLEEGVPEHRDMIFRETFGHFADLMTDPFGNYLCQKLLEYSTDDQRNIICESVAQELVTISLNMHGTRAVQKMIDFLSTRRQIHSIIVALSMHVVMLIKDLNGNHVIQKCLNKLAPEDNQFIYNAVANNCVEVATHRHGCCVLQRCVDHASEHQRVQLVNEITYNALTLVQDPYGNYVVQYILDLNDNRFSDAVIRQFAGNVCALSVQKFSSNVIEKCIRVAEHSTRKMLIEELLNRTRLEKLLRDSYGNYCVQTALDYAEPAQRALLVEGIRPVLPLIRNTPYGKRIQNKLQREHMDHYGGGYTHPQALVNMTMQGHGMGVARGLNPLAEVYGAAGYAAGLHGAMMQHHPHAIDGYVLQAHSSHNSHGSSGRHSGGYSGFNGVNAYPAVGIADHYQRASSFGYGM